MNVGKRKLKIDVCKSGARYGEPGEVVTTIKRVVWSEPIGNFAPVFCRYKGEKKIVNSRLGDLSDPFRRTDEYRKSLYIEEDRGGSLEMKSSAVLLGHKGGSSKSERKAASSKINGRLGGRPRRIQKEADETL